jgi:hypothetical protein
LACGRIGALGYVGFEDRFTSTVINPVRPLPISLAKKCRPVYEIVKRADGEKIFP